MLTERLVPGLRVLFVGYNPSLTSFERGFNYAGKSNRFYRILFDSGLTDELHPPEESPMFVERYRYGFTNIVARPTKRADELTKEDYQAGRLILLDKLQQYRPDIACYVGKGVYTAFARAKGPVQWGPQPNSQVPGVRDFVAPSSSGLVRMKLAEQVAVYAELAVALGRRKAGLLGCPDG